MTNTSHKAYYENLDVGDRHIRILHLKPGSFTEPIAGELSVVQLDHAPYFEALSYAWGAPDVTRVITLQGHRVEVTVNLFNALRRVRNESKERPLWVDALCINHSDEVEKSRQVSMMGEIYTKTSRALLWLGDFDEDNVFSRSADLRPDSTVSLATSSSQPPPNTIDRETGEAAFDLLQAISRDEHCEGHANPEASKKRLLALGRLPELSWWTRIWTIQEMILPSWCTFICGDRLIELEQVLIALHRAASHIMQGCCNEYDDHKDGFKKFFNEIATIANLLEKPPDVHRLMIAFNSFRSGYEPERQSLCPGWLGAWRLDCIIRANEVNRSPNLPSWIPDLTAKCRRQDTSWIGVYETFNAHTGVQACLKDASSPLNDEIQLTGYEIDRIVAVGRPYFVSEQPPMVDWQDVMTRQCSIFGEHYPLGGTYESAFWVTIMAGATLDPKTGGHRRATSDDNAEIQRTWHKPNVAEIRLWLDTVFFVTQRGLIGLGSLDTEARDYVFVLDGGRMPLILRGEGVLSGDPSFSEGWYSYVGHAYVHGIMDGEASNGTWEINSVVIK